ncbi:MAG: ATP-dependent zinc metalloprotease FtsH [Breznakia sp.]
MKNKKFNPLMLLPYILLISLMVFFSTQISNGDSKKFTYNQFVKKADDLKFGDVKVGIDTTIIEVEGVYIKGSGKDKKNVKFSTVLPKTDKNIEWLEETLNEKEKNEITFYVPSNENIFLTILVNFLPLLILMGGVYFIMGKMGGGGQNKAFEFTKSKARVEGDIKTRFNDVAGCDEEKEEVKEIIDYLKGPKKYADMGARIPKGILMVGPPGTGKTLLAKSVAGEANVPFFSISGSDFVEMFVGAGASRVRDMFKKAKQAAPCIIFIDEIDAVGRQRGAGMGGGNDEREQTLNQLLVEMDGMQENTGAVIIAATNRADVLDPALLRSGRFDRQITVSLPDKKGRTEILQVHAKNKKLAKNVTLESLAKRTPGFSGADLENVLNEGAILAVRDGRKTITMADLDEGVDRVMMGPAKKSKKYTDEDKRLVAYHEAGHAVIGIKLKDADMVHKVTIIPRGDAGGYNLMLPREEKYFHTKREYMAQITGLLGGRMSEELVFGEITAGAMNDIEKITKIAKAMVRVFGMSSLGPIQYGDPQGNVFLGRDYTSGSQYSGEIAFEIDKEVRKIIKQCEDECRQTLIDNRELLDLLANTLMEEETLTAEEISNLNEFGTLREPKRTKEEDIKVDEVKKAAKKVSKVKVKAAKEKTTATKKTAKASSQAKSDEAKPKAKKATTTKKQANKTAAKPTKVKSKATKTVSTKKATKKVSKAKSDKESS